MAAVSLLKLFNILTGCCLALQMTQGERNKESMEIHYLCLLPLGFFVVWKKLVCIYMIKDFS